MKKKNKGFTLIEMIVAFAVLGIAVLGIGGFFISSARSYQSVKSETALQYEAQLALNQVEGMLIDSTLGVSYNYVTNENTPGYQFVVNDAEATGTAVSKVLYAFNRAENGANYEALLLKWSAAEESLYYKEYVQPQSDDAVVSAIPIKGTTQADGWDLLADGITGFSVDLSGYEKNKKIDINITVRKQNKDYDAVGTITLRNDVLINQESIKKIYENINRIVKSTIEGVELYANPVITVPGGNVQLTTRVTGDGYPSQEIAQWIVATTEDMAVVNRIDPATGTKVDPETKVLKISDTFEVDQTTSTMCEMVYVQALADTGKRDDDNNPIYVASNPVGISIMQLSSMSVTPTADLTFAENADLIEETDFSIIKEWAPAILDQAAPDPLQLHAGNIIDMVVEITGSDSLPKNVIWSIVQNAGSTAQATISSDGQLVINKYSPGGSFSVRAALDFERTIYVDYPIVVGDTSIDATQLEITTNKNILNRGGEVQCGILFKGLAANVNDYNWSVEVTNTLGQVVSSDLVSIDENGRITADKELSYDYRYKVRIIAALKTNPSNNTSKDIMIPKVSLNVTPPVAYSNIGGTCTGIEATATGLEDYDVIWTLARETNPDYYSSSFGKTNITGSVATANGTERHFATVNIGSDEPESLTYVRVKATLKGNSNYTATMKINTKSEAITIHGDNQMNRGETLQLTAKTSTSNTVIANTELEWTIKSVKVGYYTKNDYGSSVTISDGALTVDTNYNRDQDITIVVQADWKNAELRTDSSPDTHTVTIEKLSTGGGGYPGNDDEDDNDGDDETYYETLNVETDMLLIPNGHNTKVTYYETRLRDKQGMVWSVTPMTNVSRTNVTRNYWYEVTAGISSMAVNSYDILTIKAAKGTDYGTAQLRLGFEDPRGRTYGSDNQWTGENQGYRTIYRTSSSSYSAVYGDRTYGLSYYMTVQQRKSNSWYGSSWKDVAGSEEYYARLTGGRGGSVCYKLENGYWTKLNYDPFANRGGR